VNENTAYRGVWILGETGENGLDRTAFELLAWGRPLAEKLDAPLTAVVLGPSLPAAELTRLVQCGADEVVAVESPQLAGFDVEACAACLERLVRERMPEVFLAAATTTGRSVMPYLAARIRTGLTADCTHLDVDPETRDLLQTRPAVGGNVLATIRTPRRRPQMATVRPRSARPATPAAGRTGRIERITPPSDLLRSRVRRLGIVASTDGAVGIQDADVVVRISERFANSRPVSAQHWERPGRSWTVDGCRIPTRSACPEKR